MSTGARSNPRHGHARRQIVLGSSMLAVLTLTAIFAPFIAPHDPESMSLREVLGAPSLAHPFGSDVLGRETGSIWYDDTGIFGAEQDIEAAKALLAEAGYAEGLTIEYLGLPQYPELLKTGQVLREQLKDIGIDMTIKPVNVSVWFDAYVSGDDQITSAYQERTIDPDNVYSLVIRSGGPVNTTLFTNPEVDALIDQALDAVQFHRVDEGQAVALSSCSGAGARHRCRGWNREEPGT